MAFRNAPIIRRPAELRWPVLRLKLEAPPRIPHGKLQTLSRIVDNMRSSSATHPLEEKSISSTTAPALRCFNGKVVLPDTSPDSPSLASLNGNLYLAWKGDGSDELNVEYSSNNGASFGNKYTSFERVRSRRHCAHIMAGFTSRGRAMEMTI
jgi:hypothetical protein